MAATIKQTHARPSCALFNYFVNNFLIAFIYFSVTAVLFLYTHTYPQMHLSI